MIATVERHRQMAPAIAQSLASRAAPVERWGRPPAYFPGRRPAHDAGAPTRGTVALLPSVSGVLRILRARRRHRRSATAGSAAGCASPARSPSPSGSTSVTRDRKNVGPGRTMSYQRWNSPASSRSRSSMMKSSVMSAGVTWNAGSALCAGLAARVRSTLIICAASAVLFSAEIRFRGDEVHLAEAIERPAPCRRSGR